MNRMNRNFTLIVSVLLLFAAQSLVALGRHCYITPSPQAERGTGGEVVREPNPTPNPSPLAGRGAELLLADVRYRLDASRSKFMVRAFACGLLWFKGHDHFIAVRDFDGEARLTPQAISPASLEMTVRSNSLVETRDVFTEQQKQIINKELKEIVLESDKYPTITFKSTNVTGKLRPDGSFDAKIEGELTMHGVTRRIKIPARVSLAGSDLRSQGEFTVDRSDFNVKATSAFHGTVRVRNKLKFTFDVVGHRY